MILPYRASTALGRSSRNIAAIIVATSTTHMVGALQLATVGTLNMARNGKRMM
jgi:hypothetical protein